MKIGGMFIFSWMRNPAGAAPTLMPDSGESGLLLNGTLPACFDVLASPNVLGPLKISIYGGETVRCPSLTIEPPNIPNGEAFTVVVFWPRSGSPLPTQSSSSSSFSNKGDNSLAPILEETEFATRSSTARGDVGRSLFTRVSRDSPMSLTIGKNWCWTS